MENLIFSQIPIDQLKTALSETIKKEFETFLSNIQPTKQETEYLTRKEAAKVLSVSLPTLNEWTKTGLIEGYRIASRVRYKRAELETSLSKIKSQKSKC